VAAEALSAIPHDEAALERAEAEQALDREYPVDAEDQGGSLWSGGVCRDAERPPGSRVATGLAAHPLRESANGCAPHGLGTDGATVEKRGAGVSEAGAASVCASHDPFLASLLGGTDEADAFEVDARLRRAVAAEQRRHAQLGPWLLAVARGRLYRAYGSPSLDEFAREWLGISLVKREDAEPWRAAWVAHAERISVRRLGDEVSRALALGSFEPPPLDPPTGNWDDGNGDDASGDEGREDDRPDCDVTEAADPQTGARPTLFPKSMSFFFAAPREVARLFRGALATLQRRIEAKHHRTASDSEALEAMLEHAFETWHGNLQDHHIQYRSQGGSNDLSNRTTLCVWHHQRGEHAKVVRCRGRAPARLRFELGLRPGRAPLARYRSGDVLVE
jgi:hypothetical protein